MGSLTILGNFETPSISQQRLMLEIRNLASRMTVRCPNARNENLGKKQLPGGHGTILGNFGTPSISRQRLKLEIRNFACRLTTRRTNVKNEKYVKGGRHRVT